MSHAGKRSRQWPVRPLALTSIVVGGLALGVGAFTFGYAEGWSYFSSDPTACVNCHIMTPQFDSWVSSSHHGAATCNDCHLPHALVPKWLAKGRNGFNHSWAFTFQNFPEPIQITPSNADILQSNCVDCHRQLVSALIEAANPKSQLVQCVQCHADAGHGPRAGLGR